MLIAVAAGALPRPAAAQAPAPPVIIVVDFQSVIRESEAAKTIQAQIDERRNAYQAEFSQIEQELRQAEAQLAEDRPNLTEEEFNTRRRAFEQRVVDSQRDAQSRHAALDQAMDQATNQVRDALLQVIADLAAQAGAKIVLNKTQVILTDRGLDYTDQALAELNRRLPRVDVVMPSP